MIRFQAVKTALKLWAVVYHDITNARHRNILAQIYPQNIGLLDDKAILPTGGEHLFGPKFTQDGSDGSFGGHIARFAVEWSRLTLDPLIFSTVSQGLHLDLISEPI